MDENVEFKNSENEITVIIFNDSHSPMSA